MSRLEILVTGHGEPVTVFAHGLTGGIADTRPLGSGVAGRRVFFHFRGHGRSDPPPVPLRYSDLAADLLAVADEYGASRALGVSLGAGALCHLLTASPDRFEKLVFYLPAVLDQPRTGPATDRLRALLAAARVGDRSAAAAVLAADVPAAFRDTQDAEFFLRARLDAIFGDGLAEALAELPGDVALPDRAALAKVHVPALVIGCQGDDGHPAEVASELAAALPRSTLHIYDRPGILWTARADLRARVSGFLAS